MSCGPCEGTGFVNINQVPAKVVDSAEKSADFHAAILDWIDENDCHDVAVCGCCGDGMTWHDEPGEHDEACFGMSGPYAYNGGVPECF